MKTTIVMLTWLLIPHPSNVHLSDQVVDSIATRMIVSYIPPFDVGLFLSIEEQQQLMTSIAKVGTMGRKVVMLIDVVSTTSFLDSCLLVDNV
jgi:hypothetical protein